MDYAKWSGDKGSIPLEIDHGLGLAPDQRGDGVEVAVAPLSSVTV